MNNELPKSDKIRAFLFGTVSGLAGLGLLAVLLFQIPAVKDRYGWRVDFAEVYLRGVIDPVKPLLAPRRPIQNEEKPSHAKDNFSEIDRLGIAVEIAGSLCARGCASGADGLRCCRRLPAMRD